MRAGERKAEFAWTRGPGDADQEAVILPDVFFLVARGDVAADAAAAIHVHAERLGRSDRDIGAIIGRRTQYAERDRIGADDELGAMRMRDPGNLFATFFDQAEIAGRLD